MPTKNYTASQAAVQITRELSVAAPGNDPAYGGSKGNWVESFGTPITLSYAYRSTAPASYPVSGMGGFQRVGAAEMAVIEDGLRKWSDVANITFNRVGSGNSGEAAYSDSAQFLIGNFTGNSAVTSSIDGYGGWSASWTQQNGGPKVYTRTAFAWFDGTAGYVTAPSFPNNAWHLIQHELGHAIGLSHPGNYDALQGTPTYAANAEYNQDTLQYTTMSYFAETNTGANFGGLKPMTPMLHDIAAIQRIYGVNATTRASDTVYGFNSNTNDQIYTFTNSSSARVFCIWDGGGTDTIDGSGYAVGSFIDLNQGAFSSIGPLTNNPAQRMTNNISIAFGAVIENAIGGSGADTFTGNSASNVLTGNGGNDIIDGAGGFDTARFGGSRAAYSVVRNQDGSITISDLRGGTPDGSDRVSNVESFQFADRTVGLAQLSGLIRNDFGADGKSDVLWRNTQTGDVSEWVMNGMTISSGVVIANAVPAAWQIQGTGDFNGDGKSDIVWRNTQTGDVSEWVMNGTTVSQGTVIASAVPLAWQIQDTGDFNGDGKADILWRNTQTGDVSEWVMNGTSISQGTVVASGVPLAWQTQGTGDFNGDGKADVLWRNTQTGDVSIWQMNGTSVTAGQVVANSVPLVWQIQGVGDFNADGKDDVLWRNTQTGDVSEWQMNGFAVTAGQVIVSAVPLAWQVQDVGDYNADGKADVLWRNSQNGDVSEWQMNGLTVASAQVIASGVPQEWQIFH